MALKCMGHVSTIMKSMVYKRLPVNCGQVSVNKPISVTYVTLKNRGKCRVSSILT